MTFFASIFFINDLTWLKIRIEGDSVNDVVEQEVIKTNIWQ